MKTSPFQNKKAELLGELVDHFSRFQVAVSYDDAMHFFSGLKDRGRIFARMLPAVNRLIPSSSTKFSGPKPRFSYLLGRDVALNMSIELLHRSFSTEGQCFRLIERLITAGMDAGCQNWSVSHSEFSSTVRFFC